MGLFDFAKGFVTFLYGAGSVSGEKDVDGNIRVFGDLGQGGRVYLGLVKPNGKTITYFTSAGKRVELSTLQ